MIFSKNIKIIRERRNLSQEQMAELLGVPIKTVIEWERDSGYPQTEMVIQIAKKLDVSLDCLLLDKQTIDEAVERICKERGITHVTHNRKIEIQSQDGKVMAAFDTFDIVKTRFWRKGMPICSIVASDSEELYFRWHPYGVYTTTSSETLGWYETEKDASQELNEISRAIQNGDKSYRLKYFADVECKGLFRGKRLK
jgi:transcriptional regulator with XRE-family HTH domain